MSVKKNINRNSSIELLRIISMFMIVFHHYCFYSGQLSSTNLSFQTFGSMFLGTGGSIGVVVFFMISGYYLINDNSSYFNFKRIMKFWLQVAFYSVSMTLIFQLKFLSDFDLEAFVKGFLPILTVKWWFASSYFLIYLLHPFLNKLLNSLDKSGYKKLLVFCVFCWFVIPTLTDLEFQSNELIYGCTVYAVGGYVRRFGLNPKLKTKHYIGLFALSFLFTYMITMVLVYLKGKFSFFNVNTTYLFQHRKITSLIIGIFLFMIFASIKPFYNKLINVIASATFGVYLIHEYPYDKYSNWGTVFKIISKHSGGFLTIIYSVLFIAILYILFTIIDLLRAYTIAVPANYLVDKTADKLIKPFKIVCNKLKCWIFGKEE